MATSLMLMAREQTPAETQERTKTHIGSEMIKLEPAKNRGRKPGSTKGPSQKKQPQRGMGVAQLERLRLQERWKKMTEITQVDSLSIPTTDQFQYQTPTATHLPFTNPIRGVHVLHGATNYGGPVIGGGGGLLCLDSGLVVQRIGASSTTGGFSGFCGGGSGQVLVEPDMRVQMGMMSAVVETSKELSSMPKMQQCTPDRCEVCSKKKRYNGENIRFNGGRDKYAAILPIRGCNFLGLNQEKQASFNGEITGFGARAAKSAVYASHINPNEGVEVVAIHRKGNSQNGNGAVLMEYEFFPGKSGKSTSSKEMEFPAEASVAVSGEACYITTTAYGYNPSNSVDLSLKL